MAVEAEDGSDTTKWLRVRGLGDALARHAGEGGGDLRSRSRAALLPLGHTGLAIWYDAGAGRFVRTSSRTRCRRRRRGRGSSLHGRPSAAARAGGRCCPRPAASRACPTTRRARSARRGSARRSRTIRRRRSTRTMRCSRCRSATISCSTSPTAAIDGEQLGADRAPRSAGDQPVGARLRRPRLGPRVRGAVGHGAAPRPAHSPRSSTSSTRRSAPAGGR